nr:hypothetical protein [Tanacetum cinerariifolium]
MTKSDQTGQKREAWRSREKSEAVTMDRARNTEENAKRMARNANTCKSYERKKQQFLAGSESRPPMLNKENYIPWSSRLLRYAKSRRNGKLIHNSILNGPYVRKMIPEPDIYAAVDSCETAQEIWLRTKDLHTADYTQLYDFLKYNQKEVDEFKAERLAKTQDPLALMANFNNPYAFSALHQDQSSLIQNYLQQPMENPEDITDPTTAMNMALALMAKAFKLNYSTPTNNN